MTTENGSSSETPTLQQNTNAEKFIVPPDAIIFYPSIEEFKDPIEYVRKIGPQAEETGICKIVPPQGWKPPFSLDIDNFKFSTRIQKLNLLDGKSRVKLNFLDQLFQFWELQGTPLILPEVEGRLIDVYALYRLTRVNYLKANNLTWINITELMGFKSKESVVSIIKEYFEQFVRPFIIFKELCAVKSEHVDFKSDTCKTEEAEVISLSDSDDDVCIVGEFKEEEVTNPHVSRELKRLRFLGAGPRMNRRKRRRHHKNISYNYEDCARFTCCGCGKVGTESSIIICRSCKDKYHFTCIKPSLDSLPKRNWNCFKCTTLELGKPNDGFGFEQAKEEVTVFEFGEMADKFKSNHFQLPPHEVSSETVEQEYWRIVSRPDREVVVKYGADLHAVDNGSGFPTDACKNLQPGDAEYVHSGWNLNNLPVLKNSLLRYINSDCSGMKIPWLYVGMCFATFCWHNEDHWLCSVNYVHWGEPKIWYGIPGKDAEAFESVMKLESPELFEAQPDILHQLVTIMNPNILMKANVPVYKVVQNEGEFVITFPRAYHMGYNQGFNFAEAVNFAPIDWFKMGRDCVLNYAQLKRFCVFSHDELLCTIASSPKNMQPVLASAIHSDMVYAISKETKMRKNIQNEGVTTTQRTELELLPDDKRHCDVCKTTCYLSALACDCNEDVVVCLDHYNDLCKCPKSKQVLRFRYTLDELQGLLGNVESVRDEYNTWLGKVENALNENCTANVPDLKKLLNEGDSRDYPDCELRKALIKVVSDV